MSLRINNNIASINGHRNMLKNDMAISKSLEKLSSGLRINKAADDAAGLIISEQMRAQITGIGQAIDNTETAIAMVQTAEGALDEMNSLLNKARELALHAANEGANDTNQLRADQAELDEIIGSISRIADNTQFGTKKLLDGTLALDQTINNSVAVSEFNARGMAADTYSTGMSVANQGTAGSTFAQASNSGTGLTPTFASSQVNSFTVGSALEADVYQLSHTAGQRGGTVSVVEDDTADAQTVLGSNILSGVTVTGTQFDDSSLANDTYNISAGSVGAEANSSVTLATAGGIQTIGNFVNGGAVDDTTITGGTVFANNTTFTISGLTDAAGGAIASETITADGTDDLDTVLAAFTTAGIDVSFSGGTFTFEATENGTYANGASLAISDGTDTATLAMDGTVTGTNNTTDLSQFGSFSSSSQAGADASFTLNGEVWTAGQARDGGDTGNGITTFTGGTSGDTITLGSGIDRTDTISGSITLSSTDLRQVTDLTDSSNITESTAFNTETSLILTNGSGQTASVTVQRGNTMQQALSLLNTEANSIQDLGITVGMDGAGEFTLDANETGTYSNDFKFEIREGNTSGTLLFGTNEIDGDGTATGVDAVATAAAITAAGVGSGTNSTITLTGQGDAANVAVLNSADGRGDRNFSDTGTGAAISLAVDANNLDGVNVATVTSGDLRTVMNTDDASSVTGDTTMKTDTVFQVGEISITANQGDSVAGALDDLNDQLANLNAGVEVSIDNANNTFTLSATDNGTYSNDLQFSIGDLDGNTLFSTTEIDGDGEAIGASTNGQVAGEDATLTLTALSDPGNNVSMTTDRYNSASGNPVTFSNEEGASITLANASNVNLSNVVTTEAETFQIGANRDQTVDIAIASMRADDLGTVTADDVDNDAYSTLADLKGTALVNGDAQDALTVIDAAIDDVTSARGDLGAIQANTLETAVNSLRVSMENLTAAESTIRDVDFAAESAKFTKNNIMIQASTAMLAQANQLPQNVLQLLG